jgi:hypothetical protein
LRYNSTSYYADHSINAGGDYLIYSPVDGVTSGNLRIRAGQGFSVSTNNQAATSPQLVIDTSGRVGIGTTTPSSTLSLGGNIDFQQSSNLTTTAGYLNIAPTSSLILDATNGTIDFRIASSERAKIDTSGRLLVGTSSSVGDYQLQLQQNTGSAPFAGSILLRRGIASASILTDYDLGVIGAGSTTDVGGSISFQSDAAWGSGDYPTRIVFSVTQDGSASPTERMRISNNGVVLIGSTSNSLANNGFFSQAPDNDYYLGLANNSGNSAVRVLLINRHASDGNLVDFQQAGALEGAISVSGTTVTYGGGHLARWSQLPNEEEPSGILKGTVMSNLHEMCEWGEEDNEQLNKTKVSDVEGDPNVAGVFVSTSFSDDGPLDFYCAMTGDMIIRIAEGITVQRGDLLMSAGDGTAKPQDDDIIRSKTIAKVTSTHVTCTYDDGSYCVPCVLMAC